MRFLIFILGALVCDAVPLLFYKLGSPPVTNPPHLDEFGVEEMELETPGAEESVLQPGGEGGER